MNIPKLIAEFLCALAIVAIPLAYLIAFGN